MSPTTQRAKRATPDPVTDELDALVDQLLHPTAPPAADEELVQLSIRLPASLRARVQERAKSQGRSMQDFVIEQLVVSVDAGEHEPGHVAARRALREALVTGAYLDYLEAIEDPDLRND